MFVEGRNFDFASQLFPEGGGGFAPVRKGLVGQVIEADSLAFQIVRQYYIGELRNGRVIPAEATGSGLVETEIRVLGTHENDKLGEHSTVLYLPSGVTGQITIRENDGRLTTVDCADINEVRLGKYVEAYLSVNGTNIFIGNQAGDQRAVAWGGEFVKGFNGRTNYFMRGGSVEGLRQDTLALEEAGILVRSIRPTQDVEEDTSGRPQYTIAA